MGGVWREREERGSGSACLSLTANSEFHFKFLLLLYGLWEFDYPLVWVGPEKQKHKGFIGLLIMVLEKLMGFCLTILKHTHFIILCLGQ